MKVNGNKLIRMCGIAVCMVLLFPFSGCGEYKDKKEMARILKQFDLTEPKIYWEGSIDDIFTDDMVIAVTHKTTMYTELELRHFKLKNAESLEYISGARPPEYFFMPEYEQLLANWSHTVSICLKTKGKGKVIEAVRQLEKLPFIKYVSPNIGYPSWDPNGVDSGVFVETGER